MKKTIFTKFIPLILLITLTLGCSNSNEAPIVNNRDMISADIIPPQDPLAVRTSKGASSLDLETPLRCSVNWKTQEMISALPFNITAFNLVKNGHNDILPRFEVTGFSFETMSAEKALLKLTKEAGIKLVAKDGPYAKIAAENLRGEFTEVVNMITEAADIYYSYDESKKTITISHKASFSLFTPQSRPIMLGLLDVLRGAGITDATTDWADYSITFDADYEIKNKIMGLIKSFEDNPTLIVYDISVFRLYPYDQQEEVNWQELMKAFDFGTIKTAKAGVIGRVLTTSNELNINTLREFLGTQAMIMPVSEGKFVVPNKWFARFDIGKCGSRTSLEQDLSILSQSSLEQKNRIFSNITLEATGGQITQFNVRSRLGENFLIIGIPNGIFGVDKPKSETVVFIVPRIIRTIKTTSKIKNNL
ncbi:MAG: hypothetical protein LBR70_00050 [Lactobacillaceae bacterium]|jgi:hypothetical protein|nr:hypothetical protein [Lactobacillaceae bacterium]